MECTNLTFFKFAAWNCALFKIAFVKFAPYNSKQKRIKDGDEGIMTGFTSKSHEEKCTLSSCICEKSIPRIFMPAIDNMNPLIRAIVRHWKNSALVISEVAISFSLMSRSTARTSGWMLKNSASRFTASNGIPGGILATPEKRYYC